MSRESDKQTATDDNDLISFFFSLLLLLLHLLHYVSVLASGMNDITGVERNLQEILLARSTRSWER